MIRSRSLLACTALASFICVHSAAAQSQTAQTTTRTYQSQSTWERSKTEMPSLSPLSGVYMGAFGGYDWTDADTENAPDPDINGGDYGLFAGYSMDTLLDRTIGLGINGSLEGHFAWSDADDDTTVGGAEVHSEKNHEWGISFRPGLSFVNQMMPLDLKPYGIVGYRNAQYETSTAAGSHSRNYDGFELGIGSEVVAYKDVGVRLDYSHVWYGEHDGVDLDENDLRLGVAYHF